MLLTSPRERDRERRLFWLLIGVWIIHLFDLGFTLLAYEQRVLIEMNPLAARVLPLGSTALVVYKLTLLVFGTGILWWFRRDPFAERCAWAYAIVCVALCLCWHRIYHDAQPNLVVLNTVLEILPDRGPVAPSSLPVRR